LINRLKSALKKTRDVLNTRVEDIFVPGRTLEIEELEDLEEALIAADLGIEAAERIVDDLKKSSRKQSFTNPLTLLEEEIEGILSEHNNSGKWEISNKPHVILIMGVNGTGKTTTAGKLAGYLKKHGKKPLLASSDTFRAAANEQLTIWAERAEVDIVQSEFGADPAAVAYDSVQKAIKGGYDAVIIDTAGRLHTKVNLMEELKKISRVCAKCLEGAPHDTILVMDATTGNNGISQARKFAENLDLTGIILTKLDSTAKGGIVVPIIDELDIPVLMVGVGESISDLVEFDIDEFTRALFES